jgi:DNA repair protein RadC
MSNKAAQTKIPQKPAPHYKGHRDRLRQRFAQGGTDALADYELLEIILFMAIPRRDVKPLAKELLKKYNSLPELLSAPIHQLTQTAGVSENVAIALKAVNATAHRMLKQDIMQKPVLNSWSRLIVYCMATMAHEKREHFRILFLNKKNELIADEIQSSGTVDHTPAYPREIMKRSLELGATALILIHNHPSGDPSPSQADIDMTGQIIRAAAPFQIAIHDHIIVSRNGYTSFKNQGLI